MKPPGHHRLLLAYYADDFTGSTDALESLARSGLKTALFLEPPTPAQLKNIPGLRAFGIVGGSRMMSPAEMARSLPPAFEVLKRSGARIVHYKTCSTFDSSPKVGSVGKAIEIARGTFGQQLTPLVVGFPAFGRHVVFGNLFARSGDSEIFRLDRHPMSRHPVTPMDEADLRSHLCRQTRLSVELIDILALRSREPAVPAKSLKRRDSSSRFGFLRGRAEILNALQLAAKKSIPPIVLFDTLENGDFPIIGGLIAALARAGKPLFCAGSSGIGYALTAHWQAQGLIERSRLPRGEIPGKKQVIVISGSCSPVTARQIKKAVKAGFVEFICDTESLAHPARAETAVRAVISEAARALTAGRHVIFHTARGVSDPRYLNFEQAVRKVPGSTWRQKTAVARARLGRSMGRILELALEQSRARRAVICGGDTATEAGRSLGVQALEFLAPATIGAPWCRVHAPKRVVHGCALICKGGQVGADDFLAQLG